MSDTPFQKSVRRSLRALRFHKGLDYALRILTLGNLNNANNVKRHREEYERNKYDLNRYIHLVSEKDESTFERGIIQIGGVRISRHTFSDLQVIKGEDYGIHWENLRHTILSRDNYECQESDGRCDGPLQIHHIIPLSKGGSNNPDNLVTLCLYHHCTRHPSNRRLRGMLYGNIWS